MLKKQDGQALLIIVLVMVIALTVGLSVLSRSNTNLKVRNIRQIRKGPYRLQRRAYSKPC